jgi:hypothetical protein
VVDGRSVCIIQTSAYRIMLAAAPRVLPIVFWQTARALHIESKKFACGWLPGVDYGPMSRTFDQFCDPCSAADPDFDWESFLVNDMLTLQEMRKEALMGKGNLYVYRRPDRFAVIPHWQLTTKNLSLSSDSQSRKHS